MKLTLHPLPAPEKLDTGLRYTDILFGFVIKELFVRLQNWPNLDLSVRLHLVAGTTLVLGSWIGFRRSLNRSGYQLKFFNLPFFRFLVDQLMLILYFRIAVLTPAPQTTPGPTSGMGMAQLATVTTTLIFYVFFLYVVWDLLGLWMIKAKLNTAGVIMPRYPEVNQKEGTMTTTPQAANPEGILITLLCFIVLGGLWFFSDSIPPAAMFVVTTIVLLAYRWLKDLRK